MKKWLLALLAVLIISIAGLYLIFPESVYAKQSVQITSTQEGTMRFLNSRENWKKLLTHTALNKDSTILFSRNGYDFFLKGVGSNAIDLTIQKYKTTIESSMFILPYQVDSFRLDWISVFKPTKNPFKRAQNYFTAVKLNRVFKQILDSIGNSLSKVKTIYGFDIKKDTIPYQNYIATKRYLSQYPSIKEIYTMVDELQAYATSVGVKQLDKPIFDVKSTEEAEYVTQVAIPIDKDIPGNEKFSHKWMMKGGNVLTAEVEGGIKKIENAREQINQYIADHRRSIIALPWLMLITDRRAQPDSSKWISRLYYPVI